MTSVSPHSLRLSSVLVPLGLLSLAAFLPSTRADNHFVQTPTEQSSGFANGSLAPFTICTTVRPNLPVATTLNGQPCAQFSWHSSSYDGRRVTKGTELCSSLAIQKEGWFGFYIYLPDPGYPMDKEAAVAQCFANNSACSSWAALLIMQNNDLRISHRYYCGEPTQATVYANFPRNRWVSVVMHFVVSHLHQGQFEIWVDGASKYKATGINFGYDKWDANDSLVPPNNIGLKIGQYDYQNENYSLNEVRTSYFTNVTEVSGNPPGILGRILNPAPGATYPAEQASLSGGAALEAFNSGFHGTGYVNFPAGGGRIEFDNVAGGGGGPKMLTIRYALGKPPRSGQLMVNGLFKRITFPTTGAWTTWADLTTTINLQSGTNNTIVFKTDGDDLANIDEITVR